MTPGMLLAILGVFGTVGIAAGAAAWLFLTGSAGERRRISSVLRPAAVGDLVTGPAQLAEASDPVLARLSRLVAKSPKEMKRLHRRMAAAGHAKASSAVYFVLAQLVLPLALAAATLLALGLSYWSVAVLAALIGYVLPGLYIGRQTKKRQKAIQNGLPDALDLLTICVEAGSALDQAIIKTGSELAIVHPALAGELQMVSTEMRAGKPRVEAFKNFATRTGVDDVQTLVAVLVQTDRFGTSVGQALRIHSETSRTKRRQRAEERAAKVGVKLVFPLALCLFPALYVVCFGPVVVAIYHAFFVGQP